MLHFSAALEPMHLLLRLLEVRSKFAYTSYSFAAVLKYQTI